MFVSVFVFFDSHKRRRGGMDENRMGDDSITVLMNRAGAGLWNGTQQTFSLRKATARQKRRCDFDYGEEVTT